MAQIVHKVVLLCNLSSLLKEKKSTLILCIESSNITYFYLAWMGKYETFPLYYDVMYIKTNLSWLYN